MKLRMQGNSIRLRVTRSELSRLQTGQRLDEAVRFGSRPGMTLGYSLQAGTQADPIVVTFEAQQILVTMSGEQLENWSSEHQVGVYASLPIDSSATLEVAIEKDFACLDRSDEHNTDTFANPLAGTLC